MKFLSAQTILPHRCSMISSVQIRCSSISGAADPKAFDAAGVWQNGLGRPDLNGNTFVTHRRC